MKLEIYLDKPLEQSAAAYFERAKKAKKKLEGAKAILEKTRKELAALQQSKEKESERLKSEKQKTVKKSEWYQKFRWFHSSQGFLCIGGRDATTNEILIKKHAEKGDIVFHTKIEGSPFFIIKAEGGNIGSATLDEAAQATASYSKGWKLGLTSLETFYVQPEQLSKSAPSGEYLTKGAFVVKGSMNFIQAKLEVGIGISGGQIIGGPVAAIQKNSEKSVILVQGREATGAIAKLIQKKLGGSLDEIIKFIPAGGVKLK